MVPRVKKFKISKTLFRMKNLLLKTSRFILVTFFNKSIRLWFGNVVLDGADWHHIVTYPFCHKCCIQKVSFLHEMLLCVYSNCNYLKNCFLSQKSQFNFLPSWTWTCLFKSLFCEKLVSQMLHLKGFFPSWTVSIE